MQDLIIIGAGDFARETIWVAERMNHQFPQWNILGYVDDGKEAGTLVDGYPILGDLGWLWGQDGPVWAVCAIGTSSTRQKVWKRLEDCPAIHPAILADPTAVIGKDAVIGKGCIICAGVILDIGVKLGNYCSINKGCVLGHDASVGDCCTLHPRVNLSGNVQVESCTDMGVGTLVREQVKIGSSTIVGMGSLVTKDIPSGVVAYGSPCRVIRENTDGIVFRKSH